MFTEKEIDNKNPNNLDVFFGYAAFTPLYKSNLINNDLYGFYEDFTMGSIKDIDIPINIDKDKTVRIWSSKSNTQEYLNFLYFCYKLPNEISVIFVNEYDEYVYSAGALNYKEVKELLKYEHKITTEEKDRYKNEWIKLANENSKIRLFKNDKIISTNYDYLDEYIDKYYDKNNIRKTVAALMGNDTENNFKF
ncbi:MAG TPA: hypothetical protein IAB38_06090 [Candidatus Onthousia excrementipullorum]|uniref:DUF3658 domain-containing protein n=1 Tax=Candidatus Onthousia excrementipullorum TaxID=2840884 RepID=A0A9D1J3Y9_9FIRM|nr:hypothetical protein [Candidatus Onthousia excrementipullorum]